MDGAGEKDALRWDLVLWKKWCENPPVRKRGFLIRLRVQEKKKTSQDGKGREGGQRRASWEMERLYETRKVALGTRYSLVGKGKKISTRKSESARTLGKKKREESVFTGPNKVAIGKGTVHFDCREGENDPGRRNADNQQRSRDGKIDSAAGQRERCGKKPPDHF